MDARTYESLKREISDSCPHCARKMTALDILFDAGPTTNGKAEKKPKPAPRPEKTDDAPTPIDQVSALCEKCKENPLRKNARACLSCSKKVCNACKGRKDKTICKDCEEMPA